ncbi:MAG: DUF1538 domain-containing protein [Treponema sp.]|jgi:hypothetical protein|nr:DUF1538 domain-containing protein [Treponema sp.]
MGMAQTNMIKIPLVKALRMIGMYATAKLGAQLRAVAFVVIYLFLAQTFILKVPVEQVFSVVLGVGATIVGLAFFLEGLFLGIMPLGEQCGLRLPPKMGSLGVAIFAVIIGVTATLAEPAISFLKLQGSVVKCWDAPLLYLVLNRGSTWLVFAIAVGVGLAVLLGVFRFIYGWPFKPAVFIMMPILLVIGFICEQDPILRPLANLAWDTGGATTGPVTVPLVIALGIGVSKIAGGNKGGASGLGVITLASGLPVLAVFALGFFLLPQVPGPSTPGVFFSPDPLIRSKAEYVAGSEEALVSLARQAVADDFLREAEFRAAFPGAGLEAERPAEIQPASTGDAKTLVSGKLLSSLKDALMAVLPLTLVLVITILIVVRERIRETDATLLGIAFTIIGMFLFGFGMERGISSLGSQAGAALPHAYEQTVRNDEAVVVQGVDRSSRFIVPGPTGAKPYIWINDGKGPKAVPFDKTQMQEATGIYRYIPVEDAVFSRWGRIAGLAAVLVFVFVLGFGATLAEPSLAALGITVEELTTGMYKKSTLVSMVAVGVGFGMAAGFGRILFNLPLAWLLGIPYAVALVLTMVSSEEFAAIAWDSAGVTTGPITVPLVIAAGLGIGKGAGAGALGGAFGVVACASVFPILAVLLSGIINNARTKKVLPFKSIL